MKIRLLLLLVFLDALFCAAKKQSGRRGKKKMTLTSKLTEIKREMDKMERQMSAQHTSIISSLDELKRQRAKPVGLEEPDIYSLDGSGSLGGSGMGSGDSGGETSFSFLGNHCLKHF